jgi:hypothetical protein
MGSEQYVEYLVARIRTMLADTRMKPITNDSEHRVDLANWLETYIGKMEPAMMIAVFQLLIFL